MNDFPGSLEERAAGLWGHQAHERKPALEKPLSPFTGAAGLGLGGLDTPIKLTLPAAPLKLSTHYALGEGEADGTQKFQFTGFEPISPMALGPEMMRHTMEVMDRVFKISPVLASTISLLGPSVSMELLRFVPLPANDEEIMQAVRKCTADALILRTPLAPDSATAKLLLSGSVDVHTLASMLQDALLTNEHEKVVGKKAHFLQMGLNYKEVDAILKLYPASERKQIFDMLLLTPKIPFAWADEVFEIAKKHQPKTFSSLDKALGVHLAGSAGPPPVQGKIPASFGVELTAKGGRYWSFDQAVYAYKALEHITGGGTDKGAAKGMEIRLEKRPEGNGSLLMEMAPITGHYLAPRPGNPPVTKPTIVLYGAAETSGPYKLPPKVHDRVVGLMNAATYKLYPSSWPAGKPIPPPYDPEDVRGLQMSLAVFREHEKQQLLSPAHKEAYSQYDAALKLPESAKGADGARRARAHQINDVIQSKGLAVNKPELLWMVGDLLDRAKAGDGDAHHALDEFISSLDPNSGLGKAVVALFGPALDEALYADLKKEGISLSTEMGKGVPAVYENVPYPLTEKFFRDRYGTVKGPLEATLKENGCKTLDELNKKLQSEPNLAIGFPPVVETSENLLARSYMKVQAGAWEKANAGKEPKPEAPAIVTSCRELDENEKTPLAFDGDYGLNTVAAVKDLQKFLNEKMDIKPPLKEDGIFGPGTAEAWMSYLLKHSPTGGPMKTPQLEQIIVHEAGHHLQYHHATALADPHMDLMDPANAKIREKQGALLLADFSSISQWVATSGEGASGTKKGAVGDVEVHEQDEHAHDIPGNLMTKGTVDSGEFLHGSADTFVTAYAMTDPKEDYAESYRVYVDEPWDLMKASPEKFLFFSALDRASGIKRYDDERIMDIAITAFGSKKAAQQKLDLAFFNLSGKGTNPFGMRAETIGLIMQTHRPLIESLPMDTGIQELDNVYTYRSTLERYTDALMSRSTFNPLTFPSKINGFVNSESFQELPESTRALLATQEGDKLVPTPEAAVYFQVLDHYRTLQPNEYQQATENPEAFLAAKGIPWKSVPAPLRALLSHPPFMSVISSHASGPEVTSVTVGPSAKSLLVYLGEQVGNHEEGKEALARTKGELLTDTGIKTSRMKDAYLGLYASRLATALQGGHHDEVVKLLKELLKRGNNEDPALSFVTKLAAKIKLPLAELGIEPKAAA